MAFPALRHRDYRNVWAALSLSQLGSQLQTATLAWQLYELTHDALLLGVLGVARVVPLVVFALSGGVVADAVDRRRLLMATQSTLLLVAATLSALTFTHRISPGAIYALAAVAGAALAFDAPARQALVAGLVPMEDLGNAMSLNATAFQLAAVFGPALAGLLIAARPGDGAAWSYALNAASFLLPIFALALLRHTPATQPTKASFAAAIQGLRFVRGQPVLWGMMWVDAIATFFAGSLLLLPIYATELLHAGPRGYGLLVAAPSAGAALTAAAMALVPEVRRAGAVVLWSVGLYGASIAVFGVSRSFPLSLALLALSGAADTVSMVIRQTVRNKLTPDALRGRMVSINMVFFIGGPQLGEAEAGAVAKAFGATFSVSSGGVACVLAALAAPFVVPALARYRSDAPPPERVNR